MFGTFKRNVGATADVKELEYIAALHQTSSVIHTDGTVSAQDVLFFLRSRYGIDITSDDAIDVVRGLAGTSRLPLPQVEKKVWRLQNEKTNVGKKLHRRRPRCCKSAEDEEQEDELAALEAQLQSLKENKTDARRGWEFPAMQRQIHREVPKNVASLVRYDMVQMMSMLLIPSILRLERHRFKAEKEMPSREPLFAGGYLNTYSLLWNSSKLAHKIIKAPVMLIQKARYKRLSRIKESLRPKPDTLILDVLRILLGSIEERDSPVTKLSDFAAQASSSVITGSTTATTGKGRYFPELKETIVTRDLIRRILENCQQEEASQDDVLIDQMMELVGGEGAILDERAFAHALTSDVKRWPLECEDDTTTTFFDVYGFGNVECNKYAEDLTPEDLLAAPSRDEIWTTDFSAKPATDTDSSDEASDSSFHSAETDIKDIERASKNDFQKPSECTETLDTGESVTSRSNPDGSKNTKGGRPLRMGKIPEFKPTTGYIDYACDSFSSLQLVTFLFGFFLSFSGLIMSLVNYTGFGINCSESFGCTLLETVINWSIFALILSTCGLLVIMPISLVNQSYLSSYPQALFALVLLIAYLAGPLLEIFLVDYVGINVSQEYLTWRESPANLLLWYAFYIFGALTFLTATRAIGSMIIPKGLARRFAILRMLFVPNDILRSTNTKRSGTYKLNAVLRRAYSIHARSYKHTKARNADHETMLAFLLYGDKDAKSGGLLWAWKNFNYLNKKEGVWFHSRLAIGQVCQFVVTATFALVWWRGTESAAQRAEETRNEINLQVGGVGAEWALYFVPEAWMIYYSFIPAGIVCLCVLVLLILITYPSTASMVLKYRSGYLPSLHDPQFRRYRKSPVYIYYNTGNMLYASIGSAGLFFILIGGLLFLLFWPPTSEFMLLLLAWGIGLGVTVGLKMVLTIFFGANFWKGLYRSRPAAANVSSLAYECWHLGLGGGVMISRLCQFLLAAAFWIGRIDSQFLSNDVEMFGYHFDTVPQKYVTEVLVHEAHRHPFFERLGAMYLMRLKHGEYFGTDAGAQWRIVFTLTIMPWLVKFSEARKHGMVDDSDSDESVDEANADWQLPGSDVFAANDDAGDVKVTGNVPWSSGDDADDGFSSAASDNSERDEARQSRRNVSWNAQYASAKSPRSTNENALGESQNFSWNQFASARSFGDE